MNAPLNILYAGTLPPHQGGSALSGALILQGLAALGHCIRAVAPITTDALIEGDAFAGAHPEISITRFPVPFFENSPDVPPPADYREREGLDQAIIPEKVMVAMASRGSAKKLLRVGSRMAGRLASDWYAVYVETPGEELGRITPLDYAALQENILFAEELGAQVIKLKSRQIADSLIDFARREGVTHVVFGQTSRSRWDIVLHGSIINRFLDEVRDATVQVVAVEQNSGDRIQETE